MLLNIGLQSWAVDLKDVGAIYPFQGWETAMVTAGVVFWLFWHVWQISHENAELKAKSNHVDHAKAKAAIDRY